MQNSNEPPKDFQEITRNELGSAIARGIAEYNTRKEKTQATVAKRKESTLRNAAAEVFKS